MKSHQKLLLENKSWAQEITANNPTYFKEHAKGQAPEFLWIGCADSRVPVSEVTNTHTGDIFVHRNVANLVVHTDLNMLSVLQYAVEVLKVQHVIVCGHYGCGGVKAAMGSDSLGLINKWLRNIKDVYRFHQDELDAIKNTDARADRLVELNVQEQMQNLAKTSIIQSAWKSGKMPILHGWVYDLKTGLLKELYTMNSKDELAKIFQYNI